MPWLVSPSDEHHPYVLLTISGDVGAGELEAAFAGTLAQCLAEDTWRVLADLRDMTGGHTVIDVFGLVQALDGLGVRRRFREAVLVSDHPGSLHLATFFEDASANRGIAVRVYRDQDDAESWLAEPDLGAPPAP